MRKVSTVERSKGTEVKLKRGKAKRNQVHVPNSRPFDGKKKLSPSPVSLAGVGGAGPGGMAVT